MADELTRLAGRWQQLPLDQALSYAGHLRTIAQELFHAVAGRDGSLVDDTRGTVDGGTEPCTSTGPGAIVPDLGAAAALDQLRVAVFDATQLADPALDARVAESLTELRRGIRVGRSAYPA
ncbi:MAG: hypothetical protein CSA84_05230 [Actinomycetales bacterium]|nr:MAG: hypothetical protein CSA84_05230 [Actinomycetales bacterium]